MASGARLTVSTLKEQDLLSDARGDGGGDAAFAGRDAGKATNVSPTGGEYAAEGVAKHLSRERDVGRNVATLGSRAEAGE